MAYRTYSPANGFTVDKLGNGDFTTIGAALTAAVSGDTIFIRTGTYAESLTFKAGVNLSAFGSDSSLTNSGNVIINGSGTFSTAGTVNLYGIKFTDTGTQCILVNGSAASILNINNCYIFGNSGGGVSLTSSSASAQINLTNCEGDEIAGNMWISTSPGTININNCKFTTSTGTASVSTTSAGPINITNSLINFALQSTATGSYNIFSSQIDGSANNIEALQVGGSGTHLVVQSYFASGTSTAITVTTTLNLYNSEISSSNTNAIDGAGTLNYSTLTFTGTSKKIATTTTNNKNNFIAKRQVFTSTGTYTPTFGMLYADIIALGGGGGGGGAGATTAAQFSAGTGGGAGEYAQGIFSAATIGTSQAVTIGAAGAANSGANGGNGGNTSVGALISANGGTGGSFFAGNTIGNAPGTTGGTGGSGGDFRANGACGFWCSWVVASSIIFSGQGANSQYGAGAQNIIGANSAGVNAFNYGAGGSGASNLTSQGARAGGTGSAGLVIVTEYINI